MCRSHKYVYSIYIRNHNNIINATLASLSFEEKNDHIIKPRTPQHPPLPPITPPKVWCEYAIHPNFMADYDTKHSETSKIPSTSSSNPC